jgi:hypothetical protein
MMKAENRREASQIEKYDLIAAEKGGRGSKWLPDATFPTGESIELKTGQRSTLKTGNHGAGQFSTTRNYTLPCFQNNAYADDIHWVVTYYDKDKNGEFYEHWYCAPRWLDGWQEVQRDKLLNGKSTRLKDLLDEASDAELRDVLIKQIHLNDPKIPSSYIENNPLCIQFDGTPDGLLAAKEKLEIGVDDES